MLTASFLLLWLGGTSLWALLVGIVVLDIGSNGMHITNQSEIYRLRPDARSRINAFYMTSCFIGAAAGSAAAAFVYDAHGWGGVCLLGTGISLAALALWAAGAVRARTPRDLRSDTP